MFSRKAAKEMERSVLQEAFRVLKSNIQFCGKNEKFKTITITSCSPGEGRTTVALNLAATLACSNINTLLINAEFRRQKKPWDFDNEVDNTFSEANSEFPGEFIKETGMKNLSYLSIGSSLSHPEILIDSVHLNKFINGLSEDFDIVIIDAPPLRGCIDSTLIAANTDATVLVVQSRLHDYRTVLQVKEQLENAGVKILGVVLSKTDKSIFKPFCRYQKHCSQSNAKGALQLEQFAIIKENQS